MKRMLSLCVCAAVALCLLPLSSCKKGSERTSYTIDAQYFPEEHKLSAVMEAVVVNDTENAFPALKFQLWPNVYREGAASPVAGPYAEAAYYRGKSYGGMDILSLTGGTYSVGGEDDTVLTVTLPEPLYPDERVSLGISFEVTLPFLNHRLGVGEHAVNLANFYPILCPYGVEGFRENVYSPCGDPFVSACADYDVRLRVPPGYAVMGAEERREGEYCLSACNVRDVAFVIGEGFTVAEEEWNGVKIRYAYQGEAEGSEGSANSAAEALGAAKKSLAFFSETFCPYAYPVYWVVQTDFPYGGMEYPMLSMISRSLTAAEAPGVIAHETAHQWWYAMVGSDQCTEAWQDEGLAEYSVALLAGHDGAFGDYRERIASSERAYRAFFSVASQLNGEADTRMSRPLSEYGSVYEYRSIAYDKGVILFDRVRLVAGEKKFARALSLYAERYSGKVASRADMVACFSAAGAHVGELFASFLNGKCVI